MNRLEVNQFVETFFRELKNSGADNPSLTGKLRSFLDIIFSLKKDIPVSIPLLRDLADITANKETVYAGNTEKNTGLIKRRINRSYLRLCRVQEELGRLNLKGAPPGVSPEDYIFSQIDFSRYREMSESGFTLLFPEGLADFSEDFFRNNFGLGRKEIQTLIEESYKKAEGIYKLTRESPLVLSIMRTLETSTENLPLFSAGEINDEIKSLLDYLSKGRKIPGTEMFFTILVYNLDNTVFTHEDGMTTNLFISPDGSLSGTFRPGNKPWTRVLIPAEQFLNPPGNRPG